MHPEEKEAYVKKLNCLSIEEKESFWLRNQKGRIYESSIKDLPLEYNWFYFKELDIWMCEIYDYDRLREGKGVISNIAFFEEKKDLKEINQQWSVL